MEKQVVSVSPPIASKINWTQIISLVVAVAAIFGVVIPEDWQKIALEVLAIATPILTLIWRNFFPGTTPTAPELREVAKDKGLMVVPPEDVKATAKPA